MAVVYSSGYVKMWSMFKVGVIADLLRLGVLMLMGPILIGILY